MSAFERGSLLDAVEIAPAGRASAWRWRLTLRTGLDPRARAAALWGAGVLCGVFALNALASRYLFWDSFLDLTAGRYIATHGIPHEEALTVAAQGREWVDQQWLAHLSYYGAWRLGGYAAVAALSNLLVATGFGLLTALQISRGVVPHRAFMWSFLAFAVCLGNTVIRAQSFSYPLVVLLLWLVLRDYEKADRTRGIWLALPVLVLWGNLHGAVLLGAAMVAGYAEIQALMHFGRGRRRVGMGYTALGALVLLTPLATPYGIGIIGYYASLIGNPVVGSFILEWSAPSFGNPLSFGFIGLLLLVVGVVGYGLGRGYRPPAPMLLVTAALALLAAHGVRYQSWFALVGVITAAEVLTHVRPVPPVLSPRVVRSAGVAAAILAASALVLFARTRDSTYERLTPRAAIDAAARYAVAQPHARILADDATASALLWRYPAVLGRVAYDARLEAYTQVDLVRWFAFVDVMTPDWDAAMAGYDVVVASRAAHPRLVDRLERLRGWRAVYADDRGIVLARVPSG